MIICPNCDHSNPDEALQCEACYTPLPKMIACPSCGASIQSDATFCGQCGSNLAPVTNEPDEITLAQTEPIAPPPPPVAPVTKTPVTATRLQTQLARLLHVQTNTLLELPAQLNVIHIGKPNDQIPPDVDVSGFPDSDVVSRIHADIRIEAGIYYIEDLSSSNGTYVNHNPLPPGDRHRLRTGDRIALGKGDKVTFLFQMS